MVVALWGWGMGSTWAQPGASWHPDADGDGEVWTQDLLELLAAFGGGWPLRASAVPNPCAEEGSVRYQGEEYAVVAIGEQCWFAENLRATRYANGEPLWANLSSPEWLSADVGAVAVYGEGAARVYAGSADERANLAAFGRLYNGWGVVDPRGLCPAGWRVPSASDWERLIEALGGPCSAGQQMLAVPQNRADFGGSRGFNALMGGGRNYGGFFGSAGEHAFFWSTDWEGRMGWYMRLEAGGPAAGGGWTNRGMGASIRCMKG